MRLTTRLLLPLLATVAAIMLVFALIALRQREQSTAAEAQRLTAAYATALGLGLEAAFRAGSSEDVQVAIDRISREPTIFGVIVYGADTRVLYTSQPVGIIETAPLGAVRRVLSTEQPENFTREIDGQRVFSIVRPLQSRTGEVVGAMEVVQPWEFVVAELQRTRKRFILNTLALLAGVTLVFGFLVRRLIARPLNGFIEAVQALGRGELGYRTPERPGGAELAELAVEFNRMADQLEQTRLGLEREAEQRVSLARRLRETEKLAVVGNLAAGLGHEIAAPLHVIRGRAEMLQRQATAEPAQRNLRIITDQIDRITQIVRSLLDFARRREPRMGTLDPAAVLTGVLEFLEGEFQRTGTTVELEARDVHAVRADRDLLHQVFINLLMNSMQAMTSCDPGSRIVRVGINSTSGDVVAITFQDNGPGIAGDALDRVFEPFFTTKQPGEGTGLGLAVVRSIVEEHGGTIEAGNAEEGGARFTLTLPAAELPAKEHAGV